MIDDLAEHWYRNSGVSAALRPLSWLYRAVIGTRRAAYVSGVLPVTRLNVPVIVIGNITVGGTGKTPLVIWLACQLKRAGYKPGIVSRGYGGQARHWPQQVRPDSDPVMVGDESILLARNTSCPVAVGPDRTTAAEALLQYNDCNVIISDDGLQHYALAREVEIAVVDGVRRFGNGYCLPAGPLREPVSRLQQVDFVVVNGEAALRREYRMRLEVLGIRNVRNARSVVRPEEFPHRQVHAVAGIGHPARFFRQLQQLGFSIVEHPFPDHHRFVSEDLAFDDDRPILMTEKDAVKCRRFCSERCWYLAVEAQPDERFESRLLAAIGKVAGNVDTALAADNEGG